MALLFMVMVLMDGSDRISSTCSAATLLAAPPNYDNDDPHVSKPEKGIIGAAQMESQIRAAVHELDY